MVEYVPLKPSSIFWVQGPRSKVQGHENAARPGLCLRLWTLDFGPWTIVDQCAGGGLFWNARARKRKSTMLPSCGCSQLRAIVLIGPMLSRSMWVASSSCCENLGFSVMPVQTRVCLIDLSIWSCGQSTTETNGNMYSVFAGSGSGLVAWITVGRR